MELYFIILFLSEITCIFHIINMFKAPQKEVCGVTLNMFKVTPPQFMIFCFIKPKKMYLN